MGYNDQILVYQIWYDWDIFVIWHDMMWNIMAPCQTICIYIYIYMDHYWSTQRNQIPETHFQLQNLMNGFICLMAIYNSYNQLDSCWFVWKLVDTMCMYKLSSPKWVHFHLNMDNLDALRRAKHVQPSSGFSICIHIISDHIISYHITSHVISHHIT